MLMRRRLSRLTVPLKALVDRFAFGSLLALSIALLFLGKADVRLIDYLGSRLTDAFVPVLAVLAEPVAASRRLAGDIGALFALREENVRLREQNRRLLEWQAAAHRLSVENAALRQALQAAPEPGLPTMVTARVVADSGGPFVHTRLVNAGQRQGVVRGMAAVNEQGLVGRVIETGQNSARVLLLTDFNSRVPVLIESSRDQAILAGDNSRQPRLMFLPLNPRLGVGDRVSTSGHGGLLPPGLAIGRIAAIGDDKVAVAPLVDWDRLDYVRLLDYPGVRAPEAEPRPAPPQAPSGSPGDEPVAGLIEVEDLASQPRPPP
jgi:rod shape-determining protein MreC